tara:strand:+ start:2449 stop:3111 length:663 start_codon:yes stop_codon:yes gene_type:complete
MKKLVLFIFFIIISGCDRDNNNMIIEGQIIDLKNSKIYLGKVDEEKIVDSTNVIDGKFTLKTYINEPIEMSLILKEKNSSEKFNFFSEPTHILFRSSKEKFIFNAQIQNSKLFTELKNIENQIFKFNEKDLELLAEQIELSMKGDQKKYDSINQERIKINQKKILFIVNYSLNNNFSPVSAFIIHKYKESINKNYIEKVYENFTDELKDSHYGKKLVSSF